jgi:hypothetical protein
MVVRSDALALPLCLSVSLSLCLSVCLSVCLCLYGSLTLCPSVYFSPSLCRFVALALSLAFGFVLWAVFLSPLPIFRFFYFLLLVGFRNPIINKNEKRKTWRVGEGNTAHNTKPKTTRESARARVTERKSEGER